MTFFENPEIWTFFENPEIRTFFENLSDKIWIIRSQKGFFLQFLFNILIRIRGSAYFCRSGSGSRISDPDPI